jgi:phosphatidylserine synthase
MNRARLYQAGANAATAVNALLGVGAILYTLAGNKLFGLLLVVGAMGFDGLDGLLHRRGGGPPSTVGRVLDSSADSISFALAPAVFVAVHTLGRASWSPYAGLALLVGAWVGVLAVARLVYFTLRGHVHPHFIGASTPQTTLAIVVLVLCFDQPAYFGAQPIVFLAIVAALAPIMILPIPYPKVRRGSPIRGLMTGVSVALAVALVPAQFVPGRGSPLYLLGEAATLAAAVGLAIYYILGPWTTGPPLGETRGGPTDA